MGSSRRWFALVFPTTGDLYVVEGTSTGLLYLMSEVGIGEHETNGLLGCCLGDVGREREIV